MKNFLLVICIIFLFGCNNKSNASPQIEVKDNNSNTEIEKIKYIDQNTMPITLYKSENKVLYRVNEIQETFVTKKDIKTIQVFPSKDEKIVLQNKKGLDFYNAWISLDQEHSIKQGFIISYELIDGTLIKEQILAPKEPQPNYDYLEIYMYDAYKHINDSWYSHIEPNEMDDNTFITSIKLTAGSKINEINSKISLTTFTFDSRDDFDEEGYYKGNSKYTIYICDKDKTC